MKYMLLLYGDETAWDQLSEAEQGAVLGEHEAFERLLNERGIAHSGEALQPTTVATTLRPGGDDVIVTDGPYAELKEQVGSFYIIEAKDLDDALDLARRCPMETGIEIRPIMEFDT